MTDQKLVVFARAPVIGGAKTRLAADLGDVAAWRIHRAMTARVMSRVLDPRWLTILAVTPDDAVWRRFPGVWPAGVPRMAQGTGDFAVRLERALGWRGGAVVIGADAPEVSAGDIAAAFTSLRRADAVFGPAKDGGFWLIGARAPLKRGALAGVRWSTRHALADARKALAGLGSHALLRELADVDTGADWRARQLASK